MASRLGARALCPVVAPVPFAPCDVLIGLGCPLPQACWEGREATGLGSWVPRPACRSADNPSGCHPAGGIRLLSHHTNLAPQSPDWAQAPSTRDLLPIPDPPPTRLCKNCRILCFRGNFAWYPLTRKFLLPVPVPPHTLPDPFSKDKPGLFIE